MPKFQTDRDVFFGICKFFSSNAWWRPIIEFIYNNCRSFQNSLEYSTEEEHIVYLKFLELVTDLVDNFMCSRLHITPEGFENLMMRFLYKPNDKATVIFETLKQATDYNEFCKQMYQCNVRIENSITKALLKFTEDQTISSVDELALKVAKQIEVDQDQEIKDLVHKGCLQMKKLMGISTLSPAVSKQMKALDDSKSIVNQKQRMDTNIKTQEEKQREEQEKNQNNDHSNKNQPIIEDLIDVQPITNVNRNESIIDKEHLTPQINELKENTNIENTLISKQRAILNNLHGKFSKNKKSSSITDPLLTNIQPSHRNITVVFDSP